MAKKTAELPPVVGPAKQIDDKFREWGLVNARLKSLSAKLLSEETELKNRYQGLMVTKVDGQLVPLADRAKQLETDIVDLADAYKTDLLGDSGLKSRKFTHGTIKWAEQPFSLDDSGTEVEESEPKKTLSGWLLKARTFLTDIKAKFFKGLKVTDVVTIKLSWDKQGLLKKFKDQVVTREQLAEAGFVVKGGPTEPDNLTVKPVEVLCQTEA